MMKIMKASAGSGKTYNLTRTYISLLLGSEDRYAYRHILAVTFTNKATSEMKARILKELHVLAKDTHNSPYLDYFVPERISSEAELQKRAECILVDILHDYSAFSISTIDRFFNHTLKAFSREIGQFSAYQLELDKDSLVRESVDRILDSLTEEQTALVSWINDGVMEQLKHGNKVNLEAGLYDMAEKLKSDGFREMRKSCGLSEEELFSKERLMKIRQECRRVMSDFHEKVSAAAKAVLDTLQSCGVDPGDSRYRFLMRVYEYVGAECASTVKMPSDSFMKSSADKDLWFSKSKAKLLEKVDGALDAPLEAFCSLFDMPFRVYNTAGMLVDQTYSLGIASEFCREFEELKKEKNVIGIDDTNSLLHDIIDGSDAPFIYEKLGVRYEHFLLDEFQDTSGIQWQNFLPLLQQSEANGNDNLVVGDVKQSIYRWRGSDWKLLSEELPKSFLKAQQESLSCNFRSTESVVKFNNDFFRYASALMGYGELYDDVGQIPMTKDAQKGQTRVSFCSADVEMRAVHESVMDAVRAGARYGDVAVLVRTNRQGAKVASALLQAGIPVLSDDSLDVKSSVTVRRLVSLLSSVDNPLDEISGFLGSELGIAIPEQYHSLVDLSEGLLRGIKSVDPGCFDGDILYVQSFMDVLREWCSMNGNNLHQFLAHWDDISPKLSSPSDSNSVRIMTIHKSKGLEFPYVILPFAEAISFHGKEWAWCRTDDPKSEDEKEAASGLSTALDGIFPVQLASETGNTLFKESYENSRGLQIVDNLNMMYVAMTRAEKSLHVISADPSSSFVSSFEKNTAVFDHGSPDSNYASECVRDFSAMLYAFLMSGSFGSASRKLEPEGDGNVSEITDFIFGDEYDFNKYERKTDSSEIDFQASYESIPLDGRLKLSDDARDFFAEDGQTGYDASPRIKGVILHDILSKVIHPDDLRAAVDDAVADGRLSDGEGVTVYSFLSERIGRAAARGWFPDDGEVSNELTLISDRDSFQVQRPDRVVTTPQGTMVIDYKFGTDMSSTDKYTRQVRRYVNIYRSMGYENVKGYIWYVHGDEVVDV